MLSVYHESIGKEMKDFAREAWKYKEPCDHFLDRAKIARMLVVFGHLDDDGADSEADWYLEAESERTISFSSFLKRYRSKEGFLKRLNTFTSTASVPDEATTANYLGGSAAAGLPYLRQSLKVSPVHLILPDGKASTLTETYSGNERGTLSRFGEYVFRYNKAWIKTWNRRWLMVDTTGVHYSKRQDRNDVKTISLGQILDVTPISPGSVSKSKYRMGSFQLTTIDKKTHIFAPENASTSAEMWCEMISSHVLFHAVQHRLSIHRIKYFVELGANVNSCLNEGKQLPLLSLALSSGATEVAEYLLRRGADASCLLRWNFLMEERISSIRILDLLLSTKQDLNVCSDDTHGWTLLHYLTHEGDIDSVRRVLSRVDDPTVKAVNTLGDCSLLLSLKKRHADLRAGEELSMLLATRSDVHKKDKSGNSVLHLAIKRKFSNLVEELLRRGVDVNEVDSEGNTALHLALKTEQPLLVHQIAKLSRCNLDAKDSVNADTALVLTLKLQDEDLGLLLMKNGAKCLDGSLNWNQAKEHDGNGVYDNALHIAIKSGFSKLAHSIIEGLGDAQAETVLCQLDSQGRPPLQLAIRTLQIALAYAMLSRLEESPQLRIQVLGIAEAKDNGDTSLLLSLRLNLTEFASYLIDMGARPSMQNSSGENALHLLVRLTSRCGSSFSRNILLTLLNHIVEQDPDICLAKDTNSEQTPLHLAAEMGEAQSARLFLKADPALANERDCNCETMMFYAVRRNDVILCELGIEFGADLNPINSAGNSLMHVAVVAADTSVLSLLLRNGAYVGFWDGHGLCPIHKAIERQDARAVLAFGEHCKQSSSLELRSEEGYTPIMFAVQSGATSAAKTLLAFNVDLRCQLPRSRIGLLEIAADLCRRDPTEFFRSGLASVVLGIDRSRLSSSETNHAARAVIESAVQAVLDEGTDIIPAQEEKEFSEEKVELPRSTQSSTNTEHRKYEQIAVKCRKTTMKLPQTAGGAVPELEREKLERLMNSVSPVVEKVIVRRIEEEARNTAEEWLQTSAGRAMLKKHLADSSQQFNVSSNDASAEIRIAFINSHIQENIEAYYSLREQLI